ncbi:hypothetical protein ACLKA6_017508 [Drosophila palustris]
MKLSANMETNAHTDPGGTLGYSVRGFCWAITTIKAWQHNAPGVCRSFFKMDGASAVTKRNSYDTSEGVQGEDSGKFRRPKGLSQQSLWQQGSCQRSLWKQGLHPTNHCSNKGPAKVARIKPAIPVVTRIFRFKQFCEYAGIPHSSAVADETVRVSLGGARTGNKLLRTQDLSIFLAVARISSSGLCDSDVHVRAVAGLISTLFAGAGSVPGVWL